MADDSKAVSTLASSIISAVEYKIEAAKKELREEIKKKRHMPSVSSNDTGKIAVANGTSAQWEKKSLLNLTYPVGSIYASTVSTNPGDIMGGSWSVMDFGITGVYAWKRET